MRREIIGGLTALLLITAILAAAGYFGGEFLALDMLSHPRPIFAILLVGLALLLLIVRAWRRAAASLLIAVALAATIALDIRETQPEAETATGPSFTLFSFNALFFNERGRDLADMIEDRQPDIAVIMEAEPLFDHLDRLRALYPTVSGCEHKPTCQLLVLSRLPGTDVRFSRLMWGIERMAIVDFAVDGAPASLVAVHLSKPYHDDAQGQDIALITQRLEGLDGPMVIAGDFNAAPWSHVFARLVDDNGFASPGGYRSTWPASFGAYGMPIDHVAVRGGAVVTAIRALDDPFGSNHRGLWSEIRLPAAAPPPAEPDGDGDGGDGDQSDGAPPPVDDEGATDLDEGASDVTE